MAFGFVASSILGLIIGVRCRVFALVPITLVWAAVTVSVGILANLGGMAILAITAATTVCIQLGYVCGSFGASIGEHPVGASALHAAAGKTQRQYGLRVK